MKDYYKTLGLRANASEIEIKAAYRALAKKYHPDLNVNNPAAAARLLDVNEAYEVLSNPVERKKYDGEVKLAGWQKKHTAPPETQFSQQSKNFQNARFFGGQQQRPSGPQGPTPGSFGAGQAKAMYASDLEQIKNVSYNSGYTKGFNDGVNSIKANSGTDAQSNFDRGYTRGFNDARQKAAEINSIYAAQETDLSRQIATLTISFKTAETRATEAEALNAALWDELNDLRSNQQEAAKATELGNELDNVRVKKITALQERIAFADEKIAELEVKVSDYETQFKTAEEAAGESAIKIIELTEQNEDLKARLSKYERVKEREDRLNKLREARRIQSETE